MSKPVTKNETAGTFVTLQELVDLRKLAALEPLISIKKKLALSGEKLTSVRGRGIEFDATREYQAGDDIRSMAWRVTARSLKPHIKVYREEKERPVWLAVDLSPSLYFGTRCMFKSVKCIAEAAMTGWYSLQKRERIGAIISAALKPVVFQPQANEKYYLAILNALAEASKPVLTEKVQTSVRPEEARQRRLEGLLVQPSVLRDGADAPPQDERLYAPPQDQRVHATKLLQPAVNELHSLLLSLQQHTRTGSLIYIYSDFYDFNPETEKLILYLAQRAHVILNFIYDPFEAAPPPPNRYILTNGQQKLLFDMQATNNRENYRQLFQSKVQQLKDFARKHQIALRMHCTDISREEYL